MEDRFKFRLWIEGVGEMYYFPCFPEIDPAKTLEHEEARERVWARRGSPEERENFLLLSAFLGKWGLDEVIAPYEIMQSTGLKDKNGVLIYEGDILKDEFGNDPVRYELGGYHLGELALADMDMENFEIIGNIYEHKHLSDGAN